MKTTTKTVAPSDFILAARAKYVRLYTKELGAETTEALMSSTNTLNGATFLGVVNAMSLKDALSPFPLSWTEMCVNAAIRIALSFGATVRGMYTERMGLS